MQPKSSDPIIESILLGEFKRDVFVVRVSGAEYDECVESSNNMWSNQKKGHWGRGMVNSSEDVRKAERTGRLGEMAFAKVFGVPIDLEYRELGDKQDFMLGDKSVDVKTSLKRPKYNAGLIRAQSESGKGFELKTGVFVFAYIQEESRENEIADVVLVGWEGLSDILLRPKSPAKMGRHLNYEIPYREMKLMRDLKA